MPDIYPATPSIQNRRGRCSCDAEARCVKHSIAMPKPLAAYVLGYNCPMIREWQFMLLVLQGELNPEDHAPDAINELREAVADTLADEIPDNVRRVAGKTCQKIDAITSQRPSVPKGYEPDRGYWFEAEESTGHREWKRLVSLTDRPTQKEPLEAVVPARSSHRWLPVRAFLSG